MRLMIPAAGAFALLAAYATAFAEQARSLSFDGAEIAVDTLARLALLAWTAADGRAPENVTAIRQGRLGQAHTLIEQRIADPALSPSMVAATLGMSVRRLNLVFETSGTAFTAHLHRRRLNRAHQMFMTSPWLTITVIAYANGFESMATFFRGSVPNMAARLGTFGRRGGECVESSNNIRAQTDADVHASPSLR